MTATDRDANTAPGMPLAALALATAVLPFVTAQLSYVISAQAGWIPACITYLTGCTSVSASGRHGHAFYIYKAGMIPSAALLAAYWVLARGWLRALGARESAAMGVMVALGLTSAAFYVLYAIFVGSPPDAVYVLLRRTGAAVHLGFAAFAQIVMTREILRLPPEARARIPAAIVWAKVACVVALAVLTVVLIPIENFVDKDRGENVIEWWFTTVMVAFYVLSWRAWRATGFRAAFAVAPGRG